MPTCIELYPAGRAPEVNWRNISITLIDPDRHWQNAAGREKTDPVHPLKEPGLGYPLPVAWSCAGEKVSELPVKVVPGSRMKQDVDHVAKSATIPSMAYKVSILIFAALGGIGGLACFLQWAEIKPKDLLGWHMSLALPHWLWLAFGLLLFAFSIGLSAYTFFRQTPAPAQPSGQWKPKWQKLQWTNAERERLEGEIRKWKDMYTAENIAKTDFQKELARAQNKAAQTIFSPLQIKVFDLTSRFKNEGQQFLQANPRPRMPSAIVPESHDYAEVYNNHLAWKEKFGGWYRSTFASQLQQVTDELAARGLSDGELKTALTEMGMNQGSDKIALIAQRLRLLALALDE